MTKVYATEHTTVIIIIIIIAGAVKGMIGFGDIMGKFFMFNQSCAGGENTLAECKPTTTLEYCRTREKNRQGWVKCIPGNVIFSCFSN